MTSKLFDNVNSLILSPFNYIYYFILFSFILLYYNVVIDVTGKNRQNSVLLERKKYKTACAKCLAGNF